MSDTDTSTHTSTIFVDGIEVDVGICPLRGCRVYPPASLDAHLARHDYLLRTALKTHEPRRGKSGKGFCKQQRKRMSASGVEKKEGIFNIHRGLR